MPDTPRQPIKAEVHGVLYACGLLPPYVREGWLIALPRIPTAIHLTCEGVRQFAYVIVEDT